MTRLGIETTLRDLRDRGAKALVPYVTGGLGASWLDSVSAAIDGGATVLEIGIPFSDPVMDGPVVQQANDLALAGGATPVSIADDLAGFDSLVPLAVMTYYNIAYRMGHERFADLLVGAGVSGTILPDMPVEEAADWVAIADRAGIETVQFAAPTSPQERLIRTGEIARGFVYAVGLLGVTGERQSLADSAIDIARRTKEHTDMPVLVGVGIGSPEQAVQACEAADGVIIGSTVVRRLLENQGAAAVRDLIAEYRSALDEAFGAA